ncbi:MAG: hypothetical protein MSQ05_03075 [Akkermansia sp.]|nr:hypothetical protein [Akkermansia sp.]
MIKNFLIFRSFRAKKTSATSSHSGKKSPSHLLIKIHFLSPFSTFSPGAGVKKAGGRLFWLAICGILGSMKSI